MPEHDGKTIPTVDPKDPNSISALYGFTYNLLDGETITSSTWLINNTEVLVGGSVDGLTIDADAIVGNVTKVGLTGGTKGCRYTVTNRTETSARNSDDRSFYINIKNL